MKVIELPFNFTADVKGVNKNSDINTNINVSSQDFIIGQNGNIDCNISLEFEINVSRTMGINVIEDLNVDEYPEENGFWDRKDS